MNSIRNGIIPSPPERPSEAINFGRHLSDTAVGLATAVSALRHAVIRVVRTSTRDVNRRRDVRHPVDLPCRLSVLGQGAHGARLSDISEAGACVRGGPSLPVGTSGTLGLDGVGFPVPFSVVACAEGDLHVKFTPDSASSGSLAAAVQGLIQRRPAA
jgi:hypothetical protein